MDAIGRREDGALREIDRPGVGGGTSRADIELSTGGDDGIGGGSGSEGDER